MFQRSWRNGFLALVGWLVAGFIVVKITDALTHGTHWWIYIPFAVIGLASAVIHVATARSSSSDSRRRKCLPPSPHTRRPTALQPIPPRTICSIGIRSRTWPHFPSRNR